MKKVVLSIIMSVSFLGLTAQKQLTREAFIKFFSETPVENIEATTNEASSVIDLEKGEFVCQALMKSFLFEKALMQEHFNENYVESDKYPKAVFKGQFLDWSSNPDLSSDKEIKTKLKGTLTVHGVEKPIEADCVLLIAKGKVSMNSKFLVSPADFKIEIPGAVVDKISNEIEVTFKAAYSPI